MKDEYLSINDVINCLEKGIERLEGTILSQSGKKYWISIKTKNLGCHDIGLTNIE